MAKVKKLKNRQSKANTLIFLVVVLAVASIGGYLIKRSSAASTEPTRVIYADYKNANNIVGGINKNIITYHDPNSTYGDGNVVQISSEGHVWFGGQGGPFSIEKKVCYALRAADGVKNSTVELWGWSSLKKVTLDSLAYREVCIPIQDSKHPLNSGFDVRLVSGGKVNVANRSLYFERCPYDAQNNWIPCD